MPVFPIAGTELEFLGPGSADKYSHSFTHQLGCPNAQQYTLPPTTCRAHAHAQGAVPPGPHGVIDTFWTSPNLERGPVCPAWC